MVVAPAGEHGRAYAVGAAVSGVGSVANIVEMVATPKRRARLAKLLFGRVDKKTVWQRLFKDRATTVAFLRLLASGVGLGVAVAAARKAMMLKATQHEPVPDLGNNEDVDDQLRGYESDHSLPDAPLPKAPEVPAVVAEPAVPIAVIAEPAVPAATMPYRAYDALAEYRKSLSAEEASTRALPSALLGAVQRVTENFFSGGGVGLSEIARDWPSLRREYERLLAERICSPEPQAFAFVQGDTGMPGMLRGRTAPPWCVVFDEYFACRVQEYVDNPAAATLVRQIRASDSNEAFFQRLLASSGQLAVADPSLTPALAAALKPGVFQLFRTDVSATLSSFLQSVAAVPVLKQAYKTALAGSLSSPMLRLGGTNAQKRDFLVGYCTCLSAEEVSPQAAVVPGALVLLEDLAGPDGCLKKIGDSLFSVLSQWPAVRCEYERLLLERMRAGVPQSSDEQKRVVAYEYLKCLAAKQPLADGVVVAPEAQPFVSSLFESVANGQCSASLASVVKDMPALRDEYQHALVAGVQKNAICLLHDAIQRFIVSEYLQCLATHYEPGSPALASVQEMVTAGANDSFWHALMRCGGRLAAVAEGFDAAIGVVLRERLRAMLHGVASSFPVVSEYLQNWPLLRDLYKRLLNEKMQATQGVSDAAKRCAFSDYIKCLELESGTNGAVYEAVVGDLMPGQDQWISFLQTAVRVGQQCAQIDAYIEHEIVKVIIPLLRTEAGLTFSALEGRYGYHSIRFYPTFELVRDWPSLRLAYKQVLVEGMPQCVGKFNRSDQVKVVEDYLHCLRAEAAEPDVSAQVLESDVCAEACSLLESLFRLVSDRAIAVSLSRLVRSFPSLRCKYAKALENCIEQVGPFGAPPPHAVSHYAEYLATVADITPTEAEQSSTFLSTLATNHPPEIMRQILTFFQGIGYPERVASLLQRVIDSNSASLVSAFVTACGQRRTLKIDGQSPCMYAARAGKAGAIKALWRVGGDAVIQERDKEGRTPLLWAVSMQQAEAVKALLGAGADPRVVQKDGTTTLMYAARNHNTKIFEMILDRVRGRADFLNACDEHGATALLYALGLTYASDGSWNVKVPRAPMVDGLIEAGVPLIAWQKQNALEEKVYGGSVVALLKDVLVDALDGTVVPPNTFQKSLLEALLVHGCINPIMSVVEDGAPTSLLELAVNYGQREYASILWAHGVRQAVNEDGEQLTEEQMLERVAENYQATLEAVQLSAASVAEAGGGR